MKPEQEQNLEEIQAAAKSLISTKYRRGAEEHTDSLLDKPISELIDEALYEVTDLFVYLINAKKKVMEIKQAIDDHEQHPNRPADPKQLGI